MMTSVVVLSNSYPWLLVMQQTSTFLQSIHWDVTVTHTVWRCLDWLDRNHKMVLAGIMVTTMVHLLFSLLLLLGAMLYRRTHFIPWMVSHMIIIIIMVTTFTCWTFMSFFMHLLVAIVFPVVAGLVLGLLIFEWRLVMRTFVIWGEGERGTVNEGERRTVKKVEIGTVKKWERGTVKEKESGAVKEGEVVDGSFEKR